METKNYGLLKPAQDDFYDVDVFNTNMDKIDNELKKRSTAMENVSDSEVEFVAAEVRENIKSGETLRIIFGKIAKLFADLKKVAFTGNYKDLSDKPSMGNAAAYGVANNDTTTEEGFVADARIVKTHGDEIDVINTNLTATDNTKFRFETDGEGNYGYLKADDSFVPFSNNHIENAPFTFYNRYGTGTTVAEGRTGFVVNSKNLKKLTLKVTEFQYTDGTTVYLCVNGVKRNIITANAIITVDIAGTERIDVCSWIDKDYHYYVIGTYSLS